MAMLIRTRILIKTLNPRRSISTFPHLSQEPQLAAEPQIPEPSPLPPNPSIGRSPIYQESWRNPSPIPDLVLNREGSAQSLVPLGFLQSEASRIQAMSQTLDTGSLMNVFAGWMTSQQWPEMRQLFEFWTRSLDKNGKPNKPDVGLYNHYLRANLMSGASAADLLDLVAHMEDHQIEPNTASFNLVLKAMHNALETVAAEKLLDRMLKSNEKTSLPDDESYTLVIGMLFSENLIDAALKYLDIALKSGHIVDTKVFNLCLQRCINDGRMDTLASIIERCKKMDHNKDLCPNWNACYYIAENALEKDNSKLTFFAFEFLAKWIARGEAARPAVYLSVDEGLAISALGTAGRTYNSTLIDASWAIIKRSLRQKRTPTAEAYLGKIYAHASLGNLQRAFATLNEFESLYGPSTTETEHLFSPFTSLSPLVAACSRKGFETLDSVYFQLEALSKGETPYKSVTALNCIVLGCANIWDLDRAYQTFEAISNSFGLKPDIHSYNALISAYGKLKQTFQATTVFEHLVSLGVKPNATSYSLLVDAHLVNRDAKGALAVIDDMVKAGFKPTKEMMKKVKRRCMREFDYVSDDKVQELVKNFDIRLPTENRRSMLFNLQYSSNY